VPDTAVDATQGIAVQCHRGRPPSPAGVIEVDVAASPQAAFTGLRTIIDALEAAAPDAVRRAAASHPIEWAELVPSGKAASLSLWDVANSPSERRLDRESEQVFRILQAASDALVEAIAELQRPLVLRNCGASDVVSLRGVMRAVERSRCAGVSGLLVCGEWEATTATSAMVGPKQRMLDRLRERMAAPLGGQGHGAPAAPPSGSAEGSEMRHLAAITDEERAPAERLAAALLAVRACFFSTNYEGSILACDRALLVLRACPGIDTAEVAYAFEAQDDGVGTPAIEVDAQSIAGSARDLEALFWRSVGISHAFMGDAASAMEAFQRALAAEPSPLVKATLCMYLGLVLSRRTGRIDDAAAELERGLALVRDNTTSRAATSEGWLRNVLALTHFQRRRLRDAHEEAMRALRRVADTHDPIATHLKLDILFALSVVHEAAGRHADAIRIWHRFLEASPDWGDNFIKHYAYREGGLSLAAGNEDAVVGYQRSFESAVATGDAFHGYGIASELGGHDLAAGRRDQALHWFQEALDRGRQVGDPYRVGLAVFGIGLAGGDVDLQSGAGMLRRATTHVEPARALTRAFEIGDRAALMAALPRLGTRLNHPFDLVNV
jgi:tetratricopeptide (TPR) repeat protein